MSIEKYRGVLLVGENIEIPESINECFNYPGYIVIGDKDKHGFNLKNIKNHLSARIDENTRIDIFAHGIVSDGFHIINQHYTSTVLEALNNLTENLTPLHIHIWSCYGGAAIKDVSTLAPGSVLITHGTAEDPSTMKVDKFAITKIMKNKTSDSSLSNPFETFARELAIGSLESSTFAFSRGNELPYIFEVKPKLKELIENPKDIILKLHTNFTNFYNKIRLEEAWYGDKFSQELLIHFPSDEDITDFVQGYFFHNADINRSELPELFETDQISNINLPDIMNNNKFGNTPLLRAIGGNRLELVKLLLEHGVDVNKDSGSGGLSALSTAVRKNEPELVKLLLKYGANVGGEKDQPLFWALESKLFMIAEILIEHGADVNRFFVSNGVSSSYLSYAIYSNQPEVVKFLLQHGVDDNLDYSSALVIKTALDGNLEMLKVLWEHISKDMEVSKSLDQIHIMVIEKMLQEGMDVDQINDNGETQLSIAASYGNKEAVEMLLKNGADVNKSIKHGVTPLIIAAQKGNVEVAKLLLEFGADVNKAQDDGVIALFAATEHKQNSIVELFINLSPKKHEYHLTQEYQTTMKMFNKGYAFCYKSINHNLDDPICYDDLDSCVEIRGGICYGELVSVLFEPVMHAWKHSSYSDQAHVLHVPVQDAHYEHIEL